jgi:hypothetical protein
MQDFQELADEAFADLLTKHGRPTDLKTALRESVDDMDKRIRRSRGAPSNRPPARSGCTRSSMTVIGYRSDAMATSSGCSRGKAMTGATAIRR